MRNHSRWLGGWQAPRRCLPPPHPPTAQLRPHHSRWIVAAPGSGVERQLANSKTQGVKDKTADKTAESAAAFLSDEGTRAAVAVVGESAAERVFNKHDPWAGLPDFVGFTPRLCAAAVDASLCAAIAVRRRPRSCPFDAVLTPRALARSCPRGKWRWRRWTPASSRPSSSA